MARPWLEGVILLEEVVDVAEAEALLQADELDAAIVLTPGLPAAGVEGAAGEGRGAGVAFEVLASGRNAFATRMSVSPHRPFSTRPARFS